ncbi:glycosyl hydrolase [Micromonospora sp. NPDC049559]|uniref:glycoside hydrolase family 26 protein n=1 Tax=Micromonospora sp. NPDC049559 TaxID=3155923 RepID=UPI0034481E28
MAQPRRDWTVGPGRLLAVTGLALLALLPGACSTDRPESAPTTAPTPTATPGPEPMPSYSMNPRAPRPTQDKVMLGAYLDLHGLSQAQSVALRRKQLGRDPRILHWFYKWDDVLPAAYPGVPKGSVVMLSWDGTRYDRILNGSQDKLITASAKNLAKYQKPIFLRWAWEMNGDWSIWGGAQNGRNPQGFVQAWRHIHDIFVKQGATNVGWVWGPNYASIPGDSWNAMANYYPGDEYVDWVGVSGYTDAVRYTPDALYGAVYQQFAHRKPIMLAETGVRNKGGDLSADWIDLLRQWIDDHRGVAAMVWFDTDTHNRGEKQYINYRVDRDPAMLAAYQRLASDPHFGG